MEKAQLLERLIAGEVKLHELEKFADAEVAGDIRREFLTSQTKVELVSLKPASEQISAAKLINKNIENYFGIIAIPVGIAGPIILNRNSVNSSHYLAMATTEGALVASTSRGCKLINQAGGALTYSENVGITRAPVFMVPEELEVERLIAWVEGNFERLAKAAASTSGHLQLLRITPHVSGQNLWLRMHFATGEAMGMNMISKASNAICLELTQQFPQLNLLALSGNLCSDKKPARINLETGRGIIAKAEVMLTSELITNGLHTTADKLVAVNRIKTWEGSRLAGALTHNAHSANIIAAIWAATGQDLAHIGEASSCDTTFILQTNGDVLCRVELRNLVLGTVGGGTGLPTQAAARNLMLTDLTSKNIPIIAPTKPSQGPAKELLAEIAAAAVLAGEISLHGALAAGQLVRAHEDLGRGKS